MQVVKILLLGLALLSSAAWAASQVLVVGLSTSEVAKTLARLLRPVTWGWNRAWAW